LRVSERLADARFCRTLSADALTPAFASARWCLAWFALAIIATTALPSPSMAQSGLRVSLERLDVDGDGDIEPEEITSLSRPYLERVARGKRLSLERDNTIEAWQESARIYHALQNGASGRGVRIDADAGSLAFGPEPDEPMVPEFGLPYIKYPYIEDDLREADRTLRRSDDNRDGFIDRREARRAEWTHRDPFEEDYDKDNRLSRMELAQRYARRRLVQEDAGELIQRAQRIGNGVRPFDRPEGSSEDGRREWWRRRGEDAFASTVMDRFDLDRNGTLDVRESVGIGLPSVRIDVNRDGVLTRDELKTHLNELEKQSGNLTEGLPPWFYELDANRDDQVEMTEFAEEWSDEKMAEFESYDTNSDGILTSSEAAAAKSLVGGSFRNEQAETLPPKQSVISEIYIEEDFLIADLNVQLSITHTYAGFLDGHLVGPDGQRIELFTEVGSNDDHFNNTIFDDQAYIPIVKARPPFEGTFQPEALTKRTPGLDAFKGKSIQGTWQLVISGTRSDRFGLLNAWGLIVKPVTTLPGQ